MSLEFYKIVHVLGVVILFFAMGGMVVHAMNAGGEGEQPKPSRKMLMAFHGVALVLLLVAGFGALVKSGIRGMPPGWAWGKITIWGLLAAAPVLIKRKPDFGKALLFVLPLMGLVAASLAFLKPGA